RGEARRPRPVPPPAPAGLSVATRHPLPVPSAARRHESRRPRTSPGGWPRPIERPAARLKSQESLRDAIPYWPRTRVLSPAVQSVRPPERRARPTEFRKWRGPSSQTTGRRTDFRNAVRPAGGRALWLGWIGRRLPLTPAEGKPRGRAASEAL